MGRDASDPSAGPGSNVGASCRNQEAAADSQYHQGVIRAGQVAKHGSFQLDKDKMEQRKPIQRRISLSAYTSVKRVQMKGAHAVRPPSRTGKTWNRETPRKIKRKGQTFDVGCLPRRWPRLLARAEVFRTLQSFLNRSAVIKDDLPAAFILETSEAYICLFLAPMSNCSSSSHARWQGAVRWKQGWSSAWKGWDDASATGLHTLPFEK